MVDDIFRLTLESIPGLASRHDSLTSLFTALSQRHRSRHHPAMPAGIPQQHLAQMKRRTI